MDYWRHKIFHVLHKPDPANRWAGLVGISLAVLIVLNAAAVALETMPELTPAWRLLLDQFEAVSTTLFFIEYSLRVWVCVEQGHLARPIKGRLQYMRQPLAVLDLLVILTHFLPVDLRFLRILRLVRLLRVLGLQQLDQALAEIGTALKKRAQLLIAAIVLMLVCIYFSAALLFQIEHHAQPSIFTSIPATLWWAVVSLTTVGYGDMSPVTTLGKVFSSFMLVFGIGIFALPTAIFTAAILDAGNKSE